MPDYFAHVGDIGFTIRFRCLDLDGDPRDISTATTIQVLLEDPAGNTATKTGALTNTGTDGKFQYATVSGDLDEAGEWRAQGHLILSGGADFYTERVVFTVYPVLS